MNFRFKEKEKLNRYRFGEYRDRYTCVIVFFTKNHLIQEVLELPFQYFFIISCI